MYRYTHTHTLTHTCMHTFMYKRAHTRTHTHTHTHAQVNCTYLITSSSYLVMAVAGLPVPVPVSFPATNDDLQLRMTIKPRRTSRPSQV